MAEDLVTIHVTDGDIKQGRYNADHRDGCDMIIQICPLALAVRREWHPEAWVGPHHIGVGLEFNPYMTLTPEVASDWMREFDSYHEVKPFTFQIPRHPQGL